MNVRKKFIFLPENNVKWHDSLKYATSSRNWYVIWGSIELETSDSIYVLCVLLGCLLFYNSLVICNSKQFCQTPALELINIH